MISQGRQKGDYGISSKRLISLKSRFEKLEIKVTFAAHI